MVSRYAELSLPIRFIVCFDDHYIALFYDEL